MNYNAEQVINALINYADAEVMPKLPTSGKWVAGTAIGLASKKVNNVIEALQKNAIANMLGIIDQDGMIDVDALLAAMKNTAEKYGKITVTIPLIGMLTFSDHDIDALKNYIK